MRFTMSLLWTLLLLGGVAQAQTPQFPIPVGREAVFTVNSPDPVTTWVIEVLGGRTELTLPTSTAGDYTFPPIPFPTTGVFEVRFQVCNPFGCSGYYSEQLVVGAPPSPPSNLRMSISTAVARILQELSGILTALEE